MIFCSIFRTFDQVRSNLKIYYLQKKGKEYYNLSLEVGYMIYCLILLRNSEDLETTANDLQLSGYPMLL